MAVLPIRLYPDPVLREPAAPVAVVDEAVKKLVRDMEETMRDAPGIGLAAPQVGVQRRILVYDTGETGLRVLVNPEILEREGEDTDEEGCLSIPGLAFEVTRAETVRVRALDENGSAVDYRASELEARVIQHEVDHLDGVLFLDRLTPELRKQALREWREGTVARPTPSL